jgi:hypothetical protein
MSSGPPCGPNMWGWSHPTGATLPSKCKWTPSRWHLRSGWKQFCVRSQLSLQLLSLVLPCLHCQLQLYKIICLLVVKTFGALQPQLYRGLPSLWLGYLNFFFSFFYRVFPSLI